MRVLLFFIALNAYGQFGAAKSVINGTGAPNAALCASANNVGKVYARKDGAATGSTFYVCANTAASTYAWELAGTGSGVSAGTGINVVGSTVSVDTATMLTRERGQSGADLLCSDSGGDDTYACTLEYAPPSYVAGMCLNLKVTTTNTGAATVDANTLGAKTIKTASGGTLADGDIIVGQINRICYDGTDFRTGGGGTSVTAAAPYMVIGGTSYLPFGYAATLPPTASWTATNCGSCTFTTSGLNGSLRLVSGTSSNLQAQIRSIGSTRTLVAAVTRAGRIDNGSSTSCGIGIRGNGNGKYWLFGPGGVSGDSSIRAERWANTTTNEVSVQNGQLMGPYSLIKMVVGTNVDVYYSSDGTEGSFQLTNTLTYSTEFTGSVSSSDDWVFYSRGDSSIAGTCTLLSWSTT